MRAGDVDGAQQSRRAENYRNSPMTIACLRTDAVDAGGADGKELHVSMRLELPACAGLVFPRKRCMMTQDDAVAIDVQA